MQDCSNSSALAMELLQSCAKSSIYAFVFSHLVGGLIHADRRLAIGPGIINPGAAGLRPRMPKGPPMGLRIGLGTTGGPGLGPRMVGSPGFITFGGGWDKSGYWVFGGGTPDTDTGADNLWCVTADVPGGSFVGGGGRVIKTVALRSWAAFTVDVGGGTGAGAGGSSELGGAVILVGHAGMLVFRGLCKLSCWWAGNFRPVGAGGPSETASFFSSRMFFHCFLGTKVCPVSLQNFRLT